MRAERGKEPGDKATRHEGKATIICGLERLVPFTQHRQNSTVRVYASNMGCNGIVCVAVNLTMSQTSLVGFLYR